MGKIAFSQNFLAALRCNHLSPSRILYIQNRSLRRLLRCAVAKSNFYRELYKGINIENCRLSDLPIITKSNKMDNFDRLVTDSRLKLRGLQQWSADESNFGKIYLDEFIPIPSSGSTGKYALVVYDRNASDLIHASILARHPLHANRSIPEQLKMLVKSIFGTKVRIAVISPARGNMLFFIKAAPPFYRYFIELLFLSIFDPIYINVAELNKFQPACLSAVVSYLPVLAWEQIAGKLNIKLKRPESFLVGAAEPLSEISQELAMNAWNMKIQNDYGAAECFLMATSCQPNGHLHAMNDLCILEAVDENFNAVPNGQYGEKILVTNLASFSQPIIRYAFDDIVGYTGQPCECGLAFPSLMPIQGRNLNFIYFKKPQGGYERIHPYRLTVPLQHHYKLIQYQIIQAARNELTFHYDPQDEHAEIELHLRQTLEEGLAQAGLESQISIIVKRTETLPPDHRTGKYKPMISLGVPSDFDATPITKVY